MSKRLLTISFIIISFKIHAQIIDSSIQTSEIVINGKLENNNFVSQKAVYTINLSDLTTLGARDITEKMQFSPSVYVSKGGGGFGDSRIGIRGFSQDNISLFVNGVPETAPDYGWIYWSNWAGLEPFIDKISIENGLNNQFYTSSIGGAVSIDYLKANQNKLFELSTNFSQARGNNYLLKYSSGKLKNGFAIACGINRTSGSSFANASNINGIAYYVDVSKTFGAKHETSLTAWMANQTHWQNANMQTDSIYSIYGSKYNNAYGYLNGSAKTSATNFYKRPSAILKHLYKINDSNEMLINFSIDYGEGGAMRSLGSTLPLNNYGIIDWNKTYSENVANVQSKCFLGKFRYVGLKYGGMFEVKSQISKALKLKYGLMSYSLHGHDFVSIADLLGGSYIETAANQNLGKYNANVGDNIWYSQTSVRAWQGIFTQLQYIKNKFELGFSLTGLNNQFSFIDNFQVNFQQLKSNSKSGNAKVGLAYSTSSNSLVYSNLGYQIKTPVFRIVNNRIDSTALAEKNIAYEIGYKLNTKKLNLVVNFYYMINKDKTQQWSYTDNNQTYYANINGINAESKGIELSANIKLVKKLNLNLIGTLGDWKWQNNVTAQFTDASKNVISTFQFSGKNKPIGGAPQTSLAAIINYKPLTNLNINLETVLHSRYYAQSSISTFSNNNNSATYKLPNYHFENIYISYKWNESLKFDFQIMNLFNTKYFTDAVDGVNHDTKTSLVYVAPSRNYMIGVTLFPSSIYNKLKK